MNLEMSESCRRGLVKDKKCELFTYKEHPQYKASSRKCKEKAAFYTKNLPPTSSLPFYLSLSGFVHRRTLAHFNRFNEL